MKVFLGYAEIDTWDGLKDTMLEQYNYSERLQNAFDEIEEMGLEEEVLDYVLDESTSSLDEIYDILTIGFDEMIHLINSVRGM